MIKPLLVGVAAVACLTTPVLAQKMKMGQPTAGRYIPGGPGIYHPTHGTGYVPGGPGIYHPMHGAGYIPGRPGIYRPMHGAGYIPGRPGIYRPGMARPATFAGGYGYRRGFNRSGYGYAGGYGYTGGYGYAGGGYGSTNVGGYSNGYGSPVSAAAGIGYGVASTLGSVGYATTGLASGYGYAAYQAPQPAPVTTTAYVPTTTYVARTTYVPTLTYRPVSVTYTPPAPTCSCTTTQTSPYYNRPY